MAEAKWKEDPRKTEGNPLSQGARDLLAVLCAESPIDFVLHDDGAPAKADHVEYAFSRACRRAGLQGLTPHGLRHTFGSRLGDRDVSQKKIARLMGHSNTRHTDIYVHTTDRGLMDAVEIVAKVSDVAAQNRTSWNTQSGAASA